MKTKPPNENNRLDRSFRRQLYAKELFLDIENCFWRQLHAKVLLLDIENYTLEDSRMENNVFVGDGGRWESFVFEDSYMRTHWF